MFSYHRTRLCVLSVINSRIDACDVGNANFVATRRFQTESNNVFKKMIKKVPFLDFNKNVMNILLILG